MKPREVERVLAAVGPFVVAVMIAVLVHQANRYQQLRRAYNEVTLQVILDRVPQQIGQQEGFAIRAAVEQSHPQFLQNETLDMGIVKDSSGTWRAVH